MTGADRKRADLVLVERGVFDSRAKAQAAIAAGRVFADGVPIRKPSDPIRGTAEIEASAAHPYVSRGGIKLAAALDAFAVDPVGWDCLDVGASTGGFTDVLLRRGARNVVAVDVGRGQMHPALAADPRVRLLEATDIRRLGAAVDDASMDLACMDVSFISVAHTIPCLVRYLKKNSQLIILIKPQFEVGREGIGRGGVVRDLELAGASVHRIRACVLDLGFRDPRIVVSPIEGGDGNREFLLGAARG